jgi:hypothetical protein
MCPQEQEERLILEQDGGLDDLDVGADRGADGFDQAEEECSQ